MIRTAPAREVAAAEEGSSNRNRQIQDLLSVEGLKGDD
jgi:hypothetical protein